MPSLAFPVVVVGCDWRLGAAFTGAGFVLIDLWHTIAACSCQLPGLLDRVVVSVARTRAALWAPGAAIVKVGTEVNNAIEESVARTLPFDHPKVRRQFESAEIRAYRNAIGAREGWQIGSQIWPGSAR